MNNTYEVHCGGRIESQLDHDYDLFETDNLALYRSYSPNWEEKSRGELILTVTELNNGISIFINGIKKPIQLDASQEEQLLIALLHRNDCKIQIKESKIIKEI
jgi:hypothetical protein